MRVRTIISKEWDEIVKNKSVFWSLVLLPLLMTVISLAVFFFMRLELLRTGTLSSNGDIPGYLTMYDPVDAIMIMMVNQFMIYFLIAPVALPIYIAAYSVIGEKLSRSLEPLLATPVRTWELLLGKAVAAVVPPVIAGWLSFILFVIGARFLVSDVVMSMILTPMWVLSIAFLGPLFAVLSVLVGIIASSRMNDPRSAQQWSALFLVPLIGVGMAMMFGVIAMNVWTFVAGAAIVAVLDVVILRVAVRLFQREAILTRWK
ncbi:MAG TPA: ABC transporter permease subunit [Anaerolineae bacterium]|nr:ABC transporter permease subunit [Anaerolineae bacterium]HOQ98100.1 ABC transporter permease subunit [Anaerolineae bacterium]HPL26811.1 ABC transporter permease subunit [Anaerolineae bacterium]HPL26816.1 ABC transporter permease subunit [Anaerolineae bacterium]